ncbi:MAG: hypothetical protein DMG41_04455 [Acidobacteria bacterium]|nr:MAG: hypothetical protein DMG42_01055 [Acidobacteriota bacterium]PYT90626.1 MAG: hypothetical protein DMG41_04455 [Acidobacteriota bacterium]
MENLQGLPARHAHDERGPHQRRPTRLHQRHGFSVGLTRNNEERRSRRNDSDGKLYSAG